MHQTGEVVGPWFALLAAVLGEGVARLPATACAAAVRGAPPRRPAVQLLSAVARSAAVLGAGVATAAGLMMLAAAAWSWGAAAAVLAVAVLPLAAAPLTAAPLLGAPLRIALLAWCAVRASAGLGGSPVAPAAALAGLLAAVAVAAAAAGAVGTARQEWAAGLRRHLRDSVSVLVAAPIMLAVGVVPLLVGLPLAPWELWRHCTRGPAAPPGATPGSSPDRGGALFVLYLDGVGKTRLAPTTVARGLGAALDEALPGARFVTDVLPYSPLQSPLTERTGSGPVWRWLRRHAFPMLAGHNILQTVVASDARYQQAYGLAVAHAGWAALCRAGYRRGDRLVVLGYSGGAVVGVAAADRLADLAAAPTVPVVSIGGYLDGRTLPGRATVHHLASSADRVERLGRVMFPARWAAFADSAWNRAVAGGTVVLHEVPGFRHIGPQGYLAPGTGPAAGGGAEGEGGLTRTVTTLAMLLTSTSRR